LEEPAFSKNTMTTLQLIMEAIGALKDRTGSSVVAINKYIETEKKVRRSLSGPFRNGRVLFLSSGLLFAKPGCQQQTSTTTRVRCVCSSCRLAFTKNIYDL
jgi:linker histone H1 and H5 family